MQVTIECVNDAVALLHNCSIDNLHKVHVHLYEEPFVSKLSANSEKAPLLRRDPVFMHFLAT